MPYDISFCFEMTFVQLRNFRKSPIRIRSEVSISWSSKLVLFDCFTPLLSSVKHFLRIDFMPKIWLSCVHFGFITDCMIRIINITITAVFIVFDGGTLVYLNTSRC